MNLSKVAIVSLADLSYVFMTFGEGLDHDRRAHLQEAILAGLLNPSTPVLVAPGSIEALLAIADSETAGDYFSGPVENLRKATL